MLQRFFEIYASTNRRCMDWLHRTRVKIATLDDQFFYWRKAQSPQRVAEFVFKLKLAVVAFAVLGGAVIFSHSRYIAYQERQAQIASERELVEQRRRELREESEQKTRQAAILFGDDSSGTSVR